MAVVAAGLVVAVVAVGWRLAVNASLAPFVWLIVLLAIAAFFYWLVFRVHKLNLALFGVAGAELRAWRSW